MGPSCVSLTHSTTCTIGAAATMYLSISMALCGISVLIAFVRRVSGPR